MDPLSVSASVVALTQLIVAVAAYGSEVEHASSDRRRLQIGLETTRILLEQLDTFNVQNASLYCKSIQLMCEPQGPLYQLQVTLRELDSMLTKSRPIKILEKLMWPLDKKNVESILGVLERLKTLFIFALGNDSLKLTEAIKLDTEAIIAQIGALRVQLQSLDTSLKEVRMTSEAIAFNMKQLEKSAQTLEIQGTEREFHDVVAWICPEGFSTSQHAKLQQKLSERTRDTGTWFMQHKIFQEWSTGTSNERFLLCPGIPGAGKSVLAATVIDNLQPTSETSHSAVAFAFCVHNEQHQTTHNMVSFFIQRILVTRQVASERVVNCYKKHRPQSSRPPITELLAILKREIDEISVLYLVVDALDELESKEKLHLMQILHNLNKNVKVLMTARTISDIAIIVDKPLKLEIEASDDDVERYINHRIFTPGPLKGVASKDKELCRLIVNIVTARCRNMFLLTKLHMDAIAKKGSKKEIRQALLALPESINASYDDAFQRIDSEYRMIAFRTFSWICFAAQPLTINDVQFALAIELADMEIDENDLLSPEFITSACLGLIRIEPETSRLRLVHETLRLYLKSNIDSWMPNSQVYLTDTCLTYISTVNYAKAAEKLPRPGVRLRGPLPPFFGYATTFLTYHVEISLEDASMSRLETLFNTTDTFLALRKAFLYLARWKQDLSPFVQNFEPHHLAISMKFPMILDHLLPDDNGLNRPIFNSLLGNEECFITPLMLAIQSGKLESVRKLLDQGANALAPSKLQLSSADSSRYPALAYICPLAYAVNRDEYGIARLLLRHGAKPDEYLVRTQFPSDEVWSVYFNEIKRFTTQRPQLMRIRSEKMKSLLSEYQVLEMDASKHSQIHPRSLDGSPVYNRSYRASNPVQGGVYSASYHQVLNRTRPSHIVDVLRLPYLTGLRGYERHQEELARINPQPLEDSGDEYSPPHGMEESTIQLYPSNVDGKELDVLDELHFSIDL